MNPSSPHLRYASAWSDRERAIAKLITATRRMVDSEIEARQFIRDHGDQGVSLHAGETLHISLDRTGRLRVGRLS